MSISEDDNADLTFEMLAYLSSSKVNSRDHHAVCMCLNTPAHSHYSRSWPIFTKFVTNMTQVEATHTYTEISCKRWPSRK